MIFNLMREIGEMEMLMEGVIPPHVTMTLEQVVNAGKITNPVQTFLLANLITMFKNGGLDRWPRTLNSNTPAGEDVIEAVRSLSDHESVDLAKWMIAALQVPATFEARPSPFFSPDAKPADWVRWVTRHNH
jgi:hypothetical protein